MNERRIFRLASYLGLFVLRLEVNGVLNCEQGNRARQKFETTNFYDQEQSFVLRRELRRVQVE